MTRRNPSILEDWVLPGMELLQSGITIFLGPDATVHLVLRERWLELTGQVPNALLPDDVRRRYNSTVPLLHPERVRLEAALRALQFSNQTGPTGSRVLALIGDSTVGKTWQFLHAAMRVLGPERFGLSWDRPLVELMELPAMVGGHVLSQRAPLVAVPAGKGGFKGVLSQLCDHLGIPHSNRDTENDLVFRVARELQRVRAEYLLIDDIHSLTGDSRGDAANSCRRLISMLGLTVVFTSVLPLANTSVFNLNSPAADQVHQITRRTTTLNFHQYGEDETEAWARDLHRAMKPMKLLASPTRVEESQVAQLLHEYTSGLIGPALHLLNLAGGLATGDQERITVAGIERAIRIEDQDKAAGDD